jgi:hypothetical protein
MSNVSQSELALNKTLEEFKKLTVPKKGVAIVHLKDCNKYELMDLAAKLNIKIITPENNLFSDSYTLKVDVNPKLQILMHSTKELFCAPPLFGVEIHPLEKKFS